LAYPYRNPTGVDFIRNFFSLLLAVFKAKLKHLFDISQAFLIGLSLSTGFGNERATDYIAPVRCFPDYGSILHFLYQYDYSTIVAAVYSYTSGN